MVWSDTFFYINASLQEVCAKKDEKAQLSMVVFSVNSFRLFQIDIIQERRRRCLENSSCLKTDPKMP